VRLLCGRSAGGWLGQVPAERLSPAERRFRVLIARKRRESDAPVRAAGALPNWPMTPNVIWMIDVPGERCLWICPSHPLAHLTPRTPADTIGAQPSQLKSSNYLGLSGSSWRRSKFSAGGAGMGKTRVFTGDDIDVRSEAPSRREWSTRKITQ
jgi:hypothetical protein